MDTFTYILRRGDLWLIRVPGDADLAGRWAAHYERSFGGCWEVLPPD